MKCTNGKNTNSPYAGPYMGIDQGWDEAAKPQLICSLKKTQLPQQCAPGNGQKSAGAKRVHIAVPQQVIGAKAPRDPNRKPKTESVAA